MYCVGYVNFPTTAEGAAEREKAGPVSVDEAGGLGGASRLWVFRV